MDEQPTLQEGVSLLDIFSVSFFPSFVRPYVVLRPFLFLRSWPMNADPLMRADPAGLTRPDGCSWNPGTPPLGSAAQQAKSRFKSAMRAHG